VHREAACIAARIIVLVISTILLLMGFSTAYVVFGCLYELLQMASDYIRSKGKEARP